ncbi:VQ motif-containing protein 22 [Spatholobus suberectus]|nr:VQ motif-containing protein 22 [Spatholobus suberectus]
MSDSMTMTAGTDQWMQFYQQPLMDGHGHDHALAPNTEGLADATVMTTSPTPTMPSESNSILSQLTPKGNVSKPIRRRSRASKRTPTTLLNANTTNFRALVQQFTGCPSTTMSTLGVHKGPITLNFQQGSGQKIHHNTSRVVLPFSSGSYNNQVHQVPAPLPWQKQEEQLPQQQLLQQQQSGYSFDFVKSNDFLPNSGKSIRPSTSMDVSDGLLLDNSDFGFPDLTVNSFPSDTFYKNEL